MREQEDIGQRAVARVDQRLVVEHVEAGSGDPPGLEACDQGRVIELGTHAELMALGGRYRTMFDLQAQRFHAAEDEDGKAYDVLA